MQHEIQIEFIHKTQSRIPLLKLKWPVQGHIFKFGARFKNIGSSPINGAKIQNIVLRSASGLNIETPSNKSFNLQNLNPEESTELWFERIGTYMYGLTYITFQIVPSVVEDTIITHQKDHFSGVVTKIQTPNSWLDFFFIESKNEHVLSNTNKLLLVATMLLLLGGLPTLGYFGKWLWNLLVK